MDRRSAIVIAIALVLMVGLGAGLLILIRAIPTDVSGDPGQDELVAAYSSEVEERCARMYLRPVPGNGPATPGRASGLYMEARDGLPAIDEETWARIMDPGGPVADSWNGGSGPMPVDPALVDEPARLLLKASSREDGRSPYAFCALDTGIDVLASYSRLSRAVELHAKAAAVSGDEAAAAAGIASVCQMDLDLGRGGGVTGHVVAVTMFEDTTSLAVAPFAGVACDRGAVQGLLRDLARMAGSWPDLADNARLDGLVSETLFASCFMPPGWSPPVGPPVLTEESRKQICGSGPALVKTFWQSTRRSSLEVVGALGEKDPMKRLELVREIAGRRAAGPGWRMILDPQAFLANLSAPDLAPVLISDVRGRAMAGMTMALLALRILFLETGSVPPEMGEGVWKLLDGHGSPLVDPLTGARWIVGVEGERLTIDAPPPPAGWDWEGEPPAMEAVMHACPSR